jgi:protein phosphatase 1 regulatory subunit 7
MQPHKRITNPASIDEVLIEQYLKEYKKITIQFSTKTYNEHLLTQIDQLCLKHDDNLVIRFYGNNGDSFDCDAVSSIPNVRALNIDCLTKAHNMEAITKLLYLKRLGIGVYEMKETELLSAKNIQTVHELNLGETKTKAFNLEYLKDYKNLSSLGVSSHTKNIDAISTLSDLNSLRLSSITKTSLSFVNALKRLKVLGIFLGGRENIHEILENEIESLELVWIRGLNDLSNIGNFRKLKTLHIEDHIRLPHIHFDRPLPELTDLKVLNCKTLTSLTGLENLQALNHLRISQTNIDFEQFIHQPLPSLLKILAFYTTKSKVDAQIKKELNKMGYVDGMDRD